MITFDEDKNDAAVGVPCNIQDQANEDRDKGNAMMVSGKVVPRCHDVNHINSPPLYSTDAVRERNRKYVTRGCAIPLNTLKLYECVF